MQRITLTASDFAQLRSELPTLTFNPATDTPPAQPLLMRHLRAYRFPGRSTPHISFRVGVFESQGFRICGYYWFPEAPTGTTFLAHGYFDHVGLYGHLIEHLLQQGQAVVSFDLPGHGLSSGARLAIDSFGQYQGVLTDLLGHCDGFPRPFHAVAQSTGGAVVLRLLQSRCAAQQGNPFSRVFLLAPLIKPWLWGANIWLYRLLKPFARSAARHFRRNSSDLAFVEFLNRGEPLQARRVPLSWVGAMKQWIDDASAAAPCDWPLVVVQGERDTTVDWRYNTALIQRQFPNTDLRLEPDAQHHLVNEGEAVRAAVFRHLRFPAR